jgi:hypothetical protein
VKRIVSGLVWAAPAVALALTLALLGQDKNSGEEICSHGGQGGQAFDPDAALAAFSRMSQDFRTGEARLEKIPEPEAVKLPACTSDATWERTIEAAFPAGFDEILFVDEASFPRVADKIKRGTFVLFLPGKSVSNIAKLAQKAGARWGIASKDLIELFGIRCVPAVVVPLGIGTPSTQTGGKGAPKFKFKISSVTRG